MDKTKIKENTKKKLSNKKNTKIKNKNVKNVKNRKEEIEKLTDKWIDGVTKFNDPKKISKMFCNGGNLVGTKSQILRKGKQIEGYFKYFAKLPKIRVVSKNYNISKVSDDNSVYLNTAFIKWTWEGLEKPITARMTFLFKNNCIFQLHSSSLPNMSKKLLNVSGNV